MSIHDVTFLEMGTYWCFQFRNEDILSMSRKSRDYAEAYVMYAAQAIPQIDAEIGKIDHLWMETN